MSLRASDPQPAQVDELQLWVISEGGTLLVDVAPYEVSRVAGMVQSLLIDPNEGFLQVTISDGTALATAQWRLGQSIPIRKLIPGRLVVLDGLATVGNGGSHVFKEPLIVGFPLDYLGSSE